MTRITIVRHGTTEWMHQGRLHGRLDSQLSAEGRREARLVGLRMNGETFDALYTSPLGRTIETAAIIAREMDIEPVVVEGFREMDFGWLEGRPVEPPVGTRLSVWHKLRWAVLFPVAFLTGESWPRVNRRVVVALDWVLEQNPEGRVLLVAHGGIHSAVLHSVLRGDSRRKIPWYPLAPCGITEIEVDSSGRGTLIGLNQTDHLVTDGGTS